MKPRASVDRSLAFMTLAELTGSLGSCREMWSQALTSGSSGLYLAREHADPPLRMAADCSPSPPQQLTPQLSKQPDPWRVWQLDPSTGWHS